MSATYRVSVREFLIPDIDSPGLNIDGAKMI